MGWNSWDCFATTVTEAQTRAHAEIMADKLLRYGWKYVVVDIQWYEPGAKGYDYRKGAPVAMDANGRLLPAENRFPSSANGKGFKALADYAHGMGLKFGVHLMRGIPRQAVTANSPILGTSVHAADIADVKSTCPWNTDMFGVDMSKPGAQEYYDSVFAQFAAWQIDFVKVDDLSRPYHLPEIEAIHKAIGKTGRPMVLSLSPGETPLDQGEHVATHANMWRMSDDFWDKWPLLLEQFERCRKWAPLAKPGAYPDADMLPLGIVELGRKTRFTKDEQYTLMTLWSIARSPLMMGGDLTKLDDFTLSLLTNKEVIAVDQASSGNHQLFNHDGLVAWVADVPASKDRYLALFNTRDRAPEGAGSLPVSVSAEELGLQSFTKVRDLWKGENSTVDSAVFAPPVAFHGAALYRIAGGGR
ncbi:MAG: glycoside hydrolase family 27 protein [Luteolibacter sp.]